MLVEQLFCSVFQVLRMQAFRSLLDFKFHGLTFFERLVSVHFDGGEMYEHIFFTLIWGNETVGVFGRRDVAKIDR